MERPHSIHGLVLPISNTNKVTERKILNVIIDKGIAGGHDNDLSNYLRLFFTKKKSNVKTVNKHKTNIQ